MPSPAVDVSPRAARTHPWFHMLLRDRGGALGSLRAPLSHAESVLFVTCDESRLRPRQSQSQGRTENRMPWQAASSIP